MAQVLVNYAKKDLATALPIVNALKRAGLSVRSNPLGQSVEDPGTDACVLMLWSKEAAESVAQQEIHRAMQAWSSDRLVLAALDATPLPVGLRDLSAVPIRDASEPETKPLVDRVRAVVAGEAAAPLPAPAAAPAPSRKPRRRAPLLVGGILVLGATILAVASVFLANPQASLRPPSHLRIFVPISGTGPDADLVILLIVLALGTAVGGVLIGLWRARSRARSQREPTATESPLAMARSDETPQLFVSYSRRDERAVEQLVRELERLGYVVWIDRHSKGAHRYAAPIVRAIRSSGIVALMCSENAFTSDHVIREVYVAGDCKKPFIAFQLDPTDFPDEILYFLSGFPRIPVARIDPQQLRSEIARLIVA